MGSWANEISFVEKRDFEMASFTTQLLLSGWAKFTEVGEAVAWDGPWVVTCPICLHTHGHNGWGWAQGLNSIQVFSQCRGSALGPSSTSSPGALARNQIKREDRAQSDPQSDSADPEVHEFERFFSFVLTSEQGKRCHLVFHYALSQAITTSQ